MLRPCPLPAQGGEQVSLGDCVELAPSPGEEEGRLGRVEALWEERMASGAAKPWLRCRRYYRPQVMVLPPTQRVGGCCS